MNVEEFYRLSREIEKYEPRLESADSGRKIAQIPSELGNHFCDLFNLHYSSVLDYGGESFLMLAYEGDHERPEYKIIKVLKHEHTFHKISRGIVGDAVDWVTRKEDERLYTPRNRFNRGSKIQRDVCRSLKHHYSENLGIVPHVYNNVRFPTYTIMEYISGEDSLTWAKKKTPLEIVEMYERFLLFLAQIHDLHFVHRDIKPKNIMVLQNTRTALVDWAMATSVAKGQYPEYTLNNEILGSPCHIPLAQILATNEPRIANDVYSCATTLWSLLTGDEVDMRGSDIDTILRDPERYNNERKDKFCLGDIENATLRAVLYRAIHAPVEKQYQTTEDLRLDLEDAKEKLMLDSGIFPVHEKNKNFDTQKIPLEKIKIKKLQKPHEKRAPPITDAHIDEVINNLSCCTINRREDGKPDSETFRYPVKLILQLLKLSMEDKK